MNKIKTEVKKVAIQGGYGAFHEIAAMHYFENQPIEIVPGITFKDLFQNLKSRHADYGIMAIENMVAGSIIPNYKLLKESNMKIIGEIYLRIKQNLVALPGQKIKDIKEVYSHPMAILQCQDFFEKYSHLKSIDSADTALSAEEINNKKLIGVAAIASDMAAKKYNLEMLEESIESNKKNYTRFLILKDKNGGKVSDENANKASLSFALAHEIGSLSKILSIFSFFNINLSKIQSLPIIGKNWEYAFYVDVEINDYKTYLQSLESVKPFTRDFEILGEYQKGKSII